MVFGNRVPGWCVDRWMLRAFGLLVAVSVALLLWAVRPSESRSFAQPGSVAAKAPAPTGSATEPRWSDRPVPRLPDSSPADETGEPDPWNGPDREGLEPPVHTDVVGPADSPEPTVEVAEPELPEDPGPLQAVQEVAEAEPAYAPTAADEALLGRAVGFLDQFVSAVESNAGNCDRMADSLSDLFSSSRDLIAEGKAMVDQPARRRWFENQMQANAMAGAERMMNPLQSCMSNERMMAAFASFAEQS